MWEKIDSISNFNDFGHFNVLGLALNRLELILREDISILSSKMKERTVVRPDAVILIIMVSRPVIEVKFYVENVRLKKSFQRHT